MEWENKERTALLQSGSTRTDKEVAKGAMRSDDAGVSLHMSKVFTLGDRIPYLFIHAMLHCVGFDHEKDEDWEVMTSKEEEVIQTWLAQKDNK